MFKRLLAYFVLLAVIFTACSPKLIYVPIEGSTNVRDSVVISYRDSIKIIPVEKIVDVVRTYDTLKMETSVAKAQAFVDTTTHTLKGSLENKKEIEYKYIYKTRIEYRDSIVYEPKPYPVEKEVKYVPKIFWYSLVFSLIVLLVFGVKIYLKIKSGGIQFPKFN